MGIRLVGEWSGGQRYEVYASGDAGDYRLGVAQLPSGRWQWWVSRQCPGENGWYGYGEGEAETMEAARAAAVARVQ